MSPVCRRAVLRARYGFLAALMAMSVPAAAPRAQSPSPATTFVIDAERRLADAEEFSSRAAWVQATNITPDTDWMVARADAEKAALAVRFAAEARRIDRSSLDPTTRRKLELLSRLLDMPPPSRAGAAVELAQVSNRLASAYATGSFRHAGKTYSLKDAEEALASARDPAETQAIWEGWRSVAEPMRGDYARMVALANEGARELGFADVGAMWRSEYDQPPEAFAADVDRMWGQLQPLYGDLHCYVRSRLNARYGSSIQPSTGPIRADLVGNMWGQNWSTIYDIVGIKTSTPDFDLGQALHAQGYDAERMIRSAEGFYVSLGLQPLPQSFWERSQFTRPDGRSVDCNASAWSIDNRGDVRLKTCFTVTANEWVTAHHELGHTYYQLAYKDQPFLFQAGASGGLDEGMGDFIALSTVTPADLRQVGLLPDGQSDGDEIAGLLRVALGKLPLLAYAVSVDEWRWGVFAGRISPADYNTAWWGIVEKRQGLRPPRPRPPEANDALAKYHLPNNVPYISYFMAQVYQFQLQRAACRMAGVEGPLNQCTIRGSKVVGRRLEAMLSSGRSQPLPVTLASFTGESQADASAMADYFAPLEVWLREQNRGANCGWSGPDAGW